MLGGLVIEWLYREREGWLGLKGWLVMNGRLSLGGVNVGVEVGVEVKERLVHMLSVVR
jgi:hypothetical protein